MTISPSPQLTPLLHVRDEETMYFLYALRRTIAIYKHNTTFVKEAKELFRYVCNVSTFYVVVHAFYYRCNNLIYLQMVYTCNLQQDRSLPLMSDAAANRELNNA